MLGVWAWGQSGTSVEDQGSLEFASDYGAQRVRFKIYVLWDRKGSTPSTTTCNSTPTIFTVCPYITALKSTNWYRRLSARRGAAEHLILTSVKGVHFVTTFI